MVEKATRPREVHLPFPPSVNNLFAQNRKTGRRFPTKRYRAWRKEAALSILASRGPSFGREPVDVLIVLTPPDARKRDLDNHTKALIDALTDAQVFADDSQIERLEVRWAHAGEPPGAVVLVAPPGYLPPLKRWNPAPRKRGVPTDRLRGRSRA